MITKSVKLAGAAFLIAPAAAILAAGPALAASSGDVVVSNTETIQAYLDASGRLDVARVYEQVAMQGKGSVDLVNPVETKGLRNLDGFGGFDVKNGNMVGTYTVDGEKRLRSVSDYTKKLPLQVEVKYTLDGKPVQPGDVVGKSGLLKVQYTVRNVTGQPQDVSFDDGTGKQATASEDVVIPMVGSLTTVLPSNFTDVTSGEANMAGDGRGGTKMSFTMTLFGPIGKPEATFGYQARITDGVIPKASISALPVSPLDSPSFKGGADSYKGGAQTGATLTAGATEIDANLLKLRDGAGDLLAGLIKLRDGASQLNAGLAGEAAPGAAQLADGAGQASAGAHQLSDGVNQLDDGAKQLSAGSKDLAAGTGQLADGAGQVAAGAGDASVGADALAEGSAQVADGLAQASAKAPELIDGLTQVSDGLKLVDGGLVKMYDQIGGLDKDPGVQQLHDGMQAMIVGLGDTKTASSLIGGVEAVRSGLADAVGNPEKLPKLMSGLVLAKGGVDQVNAGLKAALADGGSIATAKANIMALKAFCTTPQCSGTVDAVANGIATELTTSTSEASGGLSQVSDGLGDASDGLADLNTKLTAGAQGLAAVECGLSNKALPNCSQVFQAIGKPADSLGLLQGVGAADAGITQLVNGVVAKVQAGIGGDKDTKADGTLRGGVHSLQAGVGLLAAGGDDLLSGLGLLTDGAGLVAAGNADLADGLGQLAGGASDLAGGAGQVNDGAKQLSSGAGQLADGTGQARDGASKLADGNQQLADGSTKLSSGLKDAADGSGQLKDGLVQAADGAPQIKDGAQQLSDQGTKKLIEAGKSTAADYGQKYALIEAGAKRAQTEGMAYGAPADAAGQTAYSYELAGADGEGGRNLGRGLGAAVVLALGAGVGLLRRKVIA